MLKAKTLMAAVAALCSAVADACTSWVIHPGVTRSGMMVVQKVLDQYPQSRKLEADFHDSPNGWRWIRIGYPNYAMNEKGVVMTTNDGDAVALKHPFDGIRYSTGPWGMIRMVANRCATAEQGVELVKSIGRDRLAAGGGIYFIADPRRAFMININHGYAEVMEIKQGMAVITNTWHLPGGEEFSLKTFGPGRSDRAREANTRASLQQLRVNGKYTIRGCIDTSRRKCGDKLNERYPFRKHPKVRSLSSVCFEIDKEFPAFLSCAYIALGPQRHTLFVPVPMALREMPQKMRDGSWGQLSWEHQKAAGSDHSDLPEMIRLEDKLLAEFNSARDQARQLLKAGKKDEAVKLLNDCFARQFAEAEALMTRIHDSATAGRNASADKEANK